jgi:large subunit ribosomal protein L10
MLKEYKTRVVDEMAETLSRSKVAVLTDFRGTPANAMTQLRRRLREAGVDYRVVKNTLTAFAADKANRDGIKPLLEGPTAIAFGYQDEVTPARVLMEYIKAEGLALRIKGAIIGETVLDAQAVSRIASIPPREVLLAELLGRLKAPVAGLVATLSAPMRGLAVVLKSRIQQMEASREAS